MLTVPLHLPTFLLCFVLSFSLFPFLLFYLSVYLVIERTGLPPPPPSSSHLTAHSSTSLLPSCFLFFCFSFAPSSLRPLLHPSGRVLISFFRPPAKLMSRNNPEQYDRAKILYCRDCVRHSLHFYSSFPPFFLLFLIFVLLILQEEGIFHSSFFFTHLSSLSLYGHQNNRGVTILPFWCRKVWFLGGMLVLSFSLWRVDCETTPQLQLAALVSIKDAGWMRVRCVSI